MPYRVLVIDDDLEFLDLMRVLLGGEGYEVFTCAESKRAYGTARTVHPDAITLDLRMPGLSGWEVLERIERDQDLKATPVVVISAAGAELAETTARLRDLGYPSVDVLVKPFEVDELLYRIADAVVAHSKR